MKPACVSLFLSSILLLVPLSAAGQQAHVNLDWAPQANARNLTPFGANVISPEVHADRTITFRLRAPDARSVALGGGPMLLALGRSNSPVPFERAADGLWTLTVGPVKPNIYIYKLLVDGVAVVDPNNTLTGFADQPGYSMVVVHGDGPAYYDARNVPHGTVTRHVYHSAVLDGEREMYVYTPPGYDARRRYPVLYLLGGSGELASTWNLDGRAGFIADNLIADGKAVPMIIVMPNNQVVHRSDPKHSDLTFVLFEKELRQHIVPLVDRTYSTVANPNGRAIAGLSMGGRHAQLVGFKSLDLFASFGILSAGDPQSEKSTPEFLNDPGINRKVDYLFVGLGTHENQPTNRSVVFHQILQKHGVAHDYYVGGDGGHDWGTWRAHLVYMLPKLWRKGIAQPAQSAPAAPAGQRGRGRGGQPIVLGPDDRPVAPPAPAGFDAPREGAARGRIDIVEYDSKTVGTRRRALVYTPPGYAANRTYPVLYLLHGIGGDEEEWRRGANPQAILDNLIADRKAVPMIVVMPNGRAQPNDRAEGNVMASAPAFARFEQDLIDDLVPFIESKYPARRDRENRAVAGLSMGGGQALNFGLGHLDLFAWIGGFSSAPNTMAPEELVRDPAKAAERLKLLWISCGDRDGLFYISQRTHAYLKDKNVPHVWHVDSGAHEFAVWKNDLYLFAQRIFR